MQKFLTLTLVCLLALCSCSAKPAITANEVLAMLDPTVSSYTSDSTYLEDLGVAFTEKLPESTYAMMAIPEGERLCVILNEHEQLWVELTHGQSLVYVYNTTKDAKPKDIVNSIQAYTGDTVDEADITMLLSTEVGQTSLGNLLCTHSSEGIKLFYTKEV